MSERTYLLTMIAVYLVIGAGFVALARWQRVAIAYLFAAMFLFLALLHTIPWWPGGWA